MVRSKRCKKCEKIYYTLSKHSTICKECNEWDYNNKGYTKTYNPNKIKYKEMMKNNKLNNWY